ncbi:MAG: hypothetical protein E8D45_03160 [Nitrospira sp.]|nr:MAG: hypothetical protein E8D45_03160 [Nitrospira sp.]
MTFFILWLHLLAAMTWIGGMLFLSLVAVPVLKPRTSGPTHAELFRAMARRFRLIVWIAIATLLSTGPLLLSSRGFSLLEPAQWPAVLSVKLGLAALLLILTGTHDLLIGPRVGALVRMPPENRTRWDGILISATPWIARGSLVFALSIVALALALSPT